MAEMQVTYDSAVLQEIRARAVEASQAMKLGGLEIGGVLFGSRAGDALTVLAWRPMPCDHSKGPGLLLSPQDEEGLQALFADGAMPEGMEVLGWFRSSRRETQLAAEDLRLHEKYFTEPWHVILVLKPKLFGASRAAVYQRDDAQGLTLEAAPVRTFDVEAPAPVRPPRGERGLEGSGRRRRAGTPEPEDAQPAPPENAGPVLEMPEAPQPRRFSPLWVAAIVLLGALAGVAALVYRQDSRPRPIPLHLGVEGANLRLTWSADTPAVRAATRGTLEIREGPSMRTVPLDRAALAGAYAAYTLIGHGDVIAKLILETPAGPIEQSAQYIGRWGNDAHQQQIEELRKERDQLKESVRKLTERAVFAERQLDQLRASPPSPFGSRPPTMRTPPTR